MMWIRQHRLVGIIVAAIMLAALAGCRAEFSPLGRSPTPTATYPVPTRTPAPPPQATATPPTFPIAQPRPGFYVISNPDGANLAPPDYPVAGDLFYLPWELAEPGPGVYNWGLLDRYLASRDAVGKRAAIAIVTYGGKYDNGLRMPQWARLDGPSESTTATIATGPNRAFPRYWSTAYLSTYGRFVQALAVRYKDDPRMEFVGIGVGMYGETKPVDDEDEAAAGEFGLTSETWVETVNAIVDIYADAFAGGAVQLFLQYAPFFEHPRERWAWSVHAAERGVGLANLALYPDYNRAVGSWGQLEPLRVYSDTVPGMFEGYLTTMPDPVEFEWGLLQALDKRVDYIRLRRQFLAEFDDATGQVIRKRTEFTDVMRRWEPYLGATAETSPSIWVALRTHRDPVCYGTFGCETPPDGWEKGNYTFFLEQVDVDGAIMVPVTNDERVAWLEGSVGQPYDATLPPGPECWVCKRTDEGKGNDRVHLLMSPEVRPRFMAGAILRVNYLDRGSDVWAFFFSDGVALRKGPTVQKEGTDTWRWAEFTLPDFRPAAAGSPFSDIILTSEGDGDEWLHLIELVPLAPVTVRQELTAAQAGFIQFDLGGLGTWAVRLDTLRDRLRIEAMPVLPSPDATQ